MRNKDRILMLINQTIWTILGVVALIGGIFALMIVLNSVIRGDKIDPSKTYGPSHNYEVPKDIWNNNKETVEWTGTTQDDDIYCDTIYYMRYNSFTDIPAGTTDTLIIVDGILYKRGTDNWIPIYLDENVMWIGGNGDTIWE